MTTTKAAPPVLGTGVDRVDGRLKVMGAAHYPSDFRLPDMAHAALVRSTIAAGTIARLDTARAAAAPGVLAVITHENAGRLHKARRNPVVPAPAPPLQDAKISYHGQYVAMVVAETRQQAAAAARLVEVTYNRDQPVLTVEDAAANARSNPYFIDMKRGNVKATIAAAEVAVAGTFTTSPETHNPLGPLTTVAHWDGDTLTVYDSTQNPFHVRAVLAGSFGLAEENVRVRSPYVGGGFGAGLRSWPHSILAALAARIVARPVQLGLTRPEMFTGVGQRPSTVQHLKIAATRDGSWSRSTTRAPRPPRWGTSRRRTRRRCDRCCKRSTTRPTRSPWARRQPMPARTSPPATSGSGSTSRRSPTCGRLAGPRATLRSSRCSTSSPTSWAWTRSSCACATTPRAIPRPRSRGRARPCASATRSAPSGSAGPSATRPLARCAMAAGWSATAWPG